MSDEFDGLCGHVASTIKFFRFGERFVSVGMTTSARLAPEWNQDAARLSFLAKIGPEAVLRESAQDDAPESGNLADEALALMEKYAQQFPESFLADYFEVMADAGFESEFEPFD